MAATDASVGKITETDTLTISGPSTLIGELGLFVTEARARYGSKGVSRAAREAFEEWLTKRGVKLDGTGSEKQTVLFMEACRSAVARGVDPVAALATAVNAKAEEEAAMPTLPGMVA